ncbi:DNA-binding response regulator [Paenibacillus chartarius]|uniref:DNA-binding response regulator n=1 Tax=Paenibacillus chartarius TaxID=747481 RepID=A0ABV6DTU9_9BACL
MFFSEAFQQWLDHHVSSRQSEAKRRLAKGLGHAEKLFLEKVWWPAYGHFHGLIPEYEVNDFRDGKRFIDFVYICGPLKLAIEIDGYGPHLQNITRDQFADQCIRQNHLILDDWLILRFSYDMVNERPRMCQQMIQQFLGKWLGTTAEAKRSWTIEEREVLRLTVRKGSHVTPKEAAEALCIPDKRSRKIMQTLVAKGALITAGKGTKRIYSYTLSPNIKLEDLR